MNTDKTDRKPLGTGGEGDGEKVVQSIPQTPAQVTLKFVSIVMEILGGVMLFAGAIILLDVFGPAGAAIGQQVTIDGIAVMGWSPIGLSIAVVASAILLLVTGRLGLIASRDAARVGAYRFLCYLVGLVLLVAVVWAWGSGILLVSNPVVIANTIIYVLICSRLADRVEEEHKEGIKGVSYTRSSSQRALFVLCEVVIIATILDVVFVAVACYLLAQLSPNVPIAVSDTTVSAGELLRATLIFGALDLGLNLPVGLLGLRGANKPDKIKPFFAISLVSTVVVGVYIVAHVVTMRGITGINMGAVINLIFYLAALALCIKIMRQDPAPQEAGDAQAAPAEPKA